MRSFLLASIAALAFPACTQDITGSPTGDDQQGGPVCGNGVVETGETCDDGNAVSGDGCSATCQTETSDTPRIVGLIAPPTLELYNPNGINLTLTAQGGFNGTANLAVSLVDAGGTAISGAVINAPATADLSSGSAIVPIMVTLPLATTGTEILGTLKVDVTSTVDPVTVSAAADIKPWFTIEYAAGTGVNPANHNLQGMTFAVKQGTIVKIKNSDTVVHETHGSGNQGSTAPFAHEVLGPDAGKPGNTYEVPTAAVTPSATVYQLGCHDHSGMNNSEYMNFTVIP